MSSTPVNQQGFPEVNNNTTILPYFLLPNGHYQIIVEFLQSQVRASEVNPT